MIPQVLADCTEAVLPELTSDRTYCSDYTDYTDYTNCTNYTDRTDYANNTDYIELLSPVKAFALSETEAN